MRFPSAVGLARERVAGAGGAPAIALAAVPLRAAFVLPRFGGMIGSDQLLQ